jgi:esterase/lipase
MLSTHPILFQDRKIRHPIYDLNLPFSDYIAQTKEIIKNNRADLQSNPEKIIADNTPFELHPENNQPTSGVLLLHGLLESPYIMKDIGMRLKNKNFLTRSILLPGHGTVPGDLLNVDYADWIQALRYGIASLKAQVEKVYLIGFSTGGSLALQHVLQHDDIAGVVLIAPAIKIRSYFDFSSNWHHAISWYWERAKWLNIEEEVDPVKYQSIPLNAAYQVYRLSLVLKELSKTHRPTCPLYFIASMADATVSAVAIVEYFKKYFHPENHMLLYSSKQTHQHDENTIVRSSVYPQLHIRELSHIGLPVSPDNPHYGQQGDYVYASHPDKSNTTIYGGFSKLENKIYDYLYTKNLVKKKHRRLTYNPDFDYMTTQIEDFLLCLSS